MSIQERLGVSIFVVDDEELIAESLTHILRKAGFEVTAFTNPVKALSELRLQPPDLLISDVMMPELSGIALATEARRLFPECKILLFSAAAEELLREANGDVGFRLVAKPLHPDDLLGEIETMMALCEASWLPDDTL